MRIIKVHDKCPRCDVLALKQYGSLTCLLCGWQGKTRKKIQHFPFNENRQCVYCHSMFKAGVPTQYICNSYKCIKQRKHDVEKRLKLIGDV